MIDEQPLRRRRGAILRNEILVRRHGRRAAGDDFRDLQEEPLRVRRRDIFSPRVVACWPDVLAVQDEEPALLAEELGRVADEAAIAAEELEALLQAVGQCHLAAVAPELPFAPRLTVVRHQEVANALRLERHPPVVAIDIGLPEVAVREEVHQHKGAALDHVYAGGLQRLQEPRRQPDRNTILVPGQTPPPGGEPERQRLAQGPALEAGEENVPRLIVTDEFAAVDVSITDPVLQRNAPLPADLTRHGLRVRGERAGPLACNGHRAVARQPARPVLVPGLERALDQQTAKAGAVDVEVGFDALAAL